MHRHARRHRSLGLLGLVVAALALAGCMTSHDVIAGKPWKLVSVAGKPPVADAGITLGEDGRYTITTGCNSGGGTYTLDGNRLNAQQATMTVMACTDATSAQEQAIMGVLASTPTYAVDTGSAHLRLTAADGTVLLFDAP